MTDSEYINFKARWNALSWVLYCALEISIVKKKANKSLLFNRTIGLEGIQYDREKPCRHWNDLLHFMKYSTSLNCTRKWSSANPVQKKKKEPNQNMFKMRLIVLLYCSKIFVCVYFI